MADQKDEVVKNNTDNIPDENPWKTLSTQPVYNNAWIKVEEHQVINPGGTPGIYGKVSFKNQAVGIIPIDDAGNTWLVGQYRYTLNEWSWEIPMGGSPNKEDKIKTAQRELEEETGLIAGNIIELLHLHPSNSVTNEQGYVYLATDLSAGMQQLEDTEKDIQVKKLAFDDALKMAQNGEITDALSVAGIFYIALNRQKYIK
ncbi:ADP-ribose pyrophosphatase [hydrothermal vent metagenome]|uniref:ADP-ribose pyrophosphatase n=1 Tax=hydrothermal vent metagenome TaxID=652676 RepID=A0A3B0Y154_9ZZZZ